MHETSTYEMVELFKIHMIYCKNLIFAIKLNLHLYEYYPIWHQEIKCMLKRRENIGGKSSIMIVEYNLRVSENEYKMIYRLKWWPEYMIMYFAVLS